MGAGSTLALLGTLVAPASPGVALDWQAPAECPDASAVQQRLAATLVDAPTATTRALTAAARVTTEADGTYALTLRISGEGVQDERTLSSGACHELADAAVLIVALAADPTVLDRGGIAPPAVPTPVVEPPNDSTVGVPLPPRDGPTTSGVDNPGASESPREDVDGAAASAARSAMPRDTGRRPPDRSRPREPRAGRDPRSGDRSNPARVRTPLRVGVRAMVGAGLSVGPAPTADLGLSAGLWGRRWRAELGLTYWTPQTAQSLSTEQDVRGRIQLWAFEPRGCFLPSVASFEFPLCGGLQIGALHAVAKGARIVEETPQRHLWLSAAFGAAAVWRPSAISGQRLGFWLRGEAHPALVRAGFSTDSGTVFDVPAIGGRVGAGLEVRLR